MGTFGCHSCGVNVKDLEGKPYEEWPCATCALSKNYTKIFSTGFFDTGKLDEQEDERLALSLDEHEFVTTGNFPLTKDEIQSLETIKNAVARQIYSVFAGMLVKFLYMAKKNPVTFEILLKKLQFPYMSYSEIGASMDPKCSKQNVLYHLKSAVDEMPELESAILTDTRYSGGHYALKTLAAKRRQEMAEQRIQRTMFGDMSERIKMYSIEELNKILKLPFMVRDEVFTFNAYLQDEEHIDGSSDDKSGSADTKVQERRKGDTAEDGEDIG